MIDAWGLGKVFQPLPWPLSLAGPGPARPIRALSGVTLHVDRGEVFGLLGPNGAGKSTLLKVLAALLPPSEGRAEIAGADLSGEPIRVRAAVGLATGEERGFYWRLTGRENLEFFAGLRGLPPRIARRRVDASLAAVDLRAVADEFVGRYSTGMRQRLALARALLGDPHVLLLDEPTRSLDPVAAEEVRSLIGLLAQGGTTIVLATHDLTEAAAVCQRVGVLAGGTLRRVLSGRIGGAELAERYRSILDDANELALPVLGVS